MKKMNNILKMISQMESNANEIKLAEHKVELSDYVDVVGSYTQLEKNYNAILKETAIARTTLKKAVELIQQQQVLTNNFNDNIVNFEKKAKDLGIDWKTVFPEFLKYQTAIKNQYAPQNLKEVVDAYNNL
jgi:hypothetical protein